MQIKSSEPMIYLGMRQFNSKAGNLITVVTLADPVKYENYDFFVDPNKVNLNGIMNNSPVVATFELGKYNNNNDLTLLGVTAASSKESVATK